MNHRCNRDLETKTECFFDSTDRRFEGPFAPQRIMGTFEAVYADLDLIHVQFFQHVFS
jgi:hypothetical protein